MVQRKLLWAGLVAVASLFISSQLFAQADVNEKRQKLMKGQSAAAKAIKGAAEAKDYATIETKAKDLMGSSEKIGDLFPKGSTAGKTKAKADIWDKWDDFGKGASKLGKAAGELAKAAGEKDDAKVQAGVKAVSGACGGCHKAFRAEKYSE
ncbi:MAG: cytochrome c [Deltaproteobacteria bacterium]|nr:cytochrome c [Deltaproteobacteria bacterium]MBI2347369.1 cytochrome c [Deltaproteobacteria bacterium]